MGYCVSLTNNFHVKDREEFRVFFEGIQAADFHLYEEGDETFSIRGYGSLCGAGTDGGALQSEQIFKSLMKHVAENDAIILTTIDMNTVQSSAVVITSTEISELNLDDISAQAARKALNNLN